MDQQTGKYIVLVGTALVLLGIIIYFFHDKLHWIGRLPGDIRITKGNFHFYFPLTSMILLSVLVTIALRLFRKC